MSEMQNAVVALPAVIAYEDAKRLVAEGDTDVRTALAARTDVQPEILYYLAEDPAPEVRQTVAANVATPVRAVEVLVRDARSEVRAALGRRLSTLLPEIDPDTQAKVRETVVGALEELVEDQVIAVRRTLAETLKDTAMVPAQIALALAKDVEREVAEPILLLCAALADEHLLEIIRAEPQSWKVGAIAARSDVSAPVAEAVVETSNDGAILVLVDNPRAEILPPTMDVIVERARSLPDLQIALAKRPRMPPDAAKRLAGFAERAVLQLLQGREDLDGDTVTEIAGVLRRRLEWLGDADPDEPVPARVVRLHTAGRLDEAMIGDAVALDARDFLAHALSIRARAPVAAVQEILKSDSPRAITALAWRAGLSMRTGIQIQHRVGVHPRKILNAKGGTDYPLTDVEMIWHLELFGIATE